MLIFLCLYLFNTHKFHLVIKQYYFDIETEKHLFILALLMGISITYYAFTDSYEGVKFLHNNKQCKE